MESDFKVVIEAVGTPADIEFTDPWSEIRRLQRVLGDVQYVLQQAGPVGAWLFVGTQGSARVYDCIRCHERIFIHDHEVEKLMPECRRCNRALNTVRATLAGALSRSPRSTPTLKHTGKTQRVREDEQVIAALRYELAELSGRVQEAINAGVLFPDTWHHRVVSARELLNRTRPEE